jgi:nicotinamide phosphoribosyltransferase
MNLILETDSYKVSHWAQYPPGTEHVYGYFEARRQGAQIPFFGLQYLLKEYLFQRISEADVDEAAGIFAEHFGNDQIFNRDGWMHIVRVHDGRLPLEIKAVGEGTVVSGGNVLFTMENTDPAVPWLTDYFDSLMTQLWYPCTVAANSREMKGILQQFADETSDDLNLAHKLHDFGYRGSTAPQAAALGGAAHLINFMGSDTIPAITFLKRYYGMDEMPAFSIPAAEHSTITSWGRRNEDMAYENMLDKYPTGLVAVVSDSYDIFNAVDNIWGSQLQEKVAGRDGTLVIRPDSGDPVVVIPRLLKILGERFGATTNSKGYWVLPPFVRLIQGDGIDINSLAGILSAMKAERWSMENIAFGSGGGLLQKVNRDTYSFAFKASDRTSNGDYHQDVYKDPVTDIGKRSKRGRLALIQTQSGRWETIPQDEAWDGTDQLKTVFRDGYILEEVDFNTIRERAA